MVLAMQVEDVRIGPLGLPGRFDHVAQPQGVVVFVHGSGSSRLSPRNRRVAEVLNHYRMDTLLFDLLTDDEAADRANVFDLDLLARRVAETLDWLAPRNHERWLPVGLFGASTGAAAALRVGATKPGRVAAVVSRGGRPDLVLPLLPAVQAATLLVVGGADTEVLRLNRAALRALNCVKRLEIVPGAGHLFEEPGTLEAVAHLAGEWFANHLIGGKGT